LAAAVLFFIWAGMLCVRGAAGQSFDLGSGRISVVSLDGAWRFHVGDSPGAPDHLDWANANFDDSSWPTIQSGKTWAVQGYQQLGGWAWYRFKVKIPAGEKPAALLLAPIVTGYQLYVDGRYVATCGSVPPNNTPRPYFNYSLYPLTTIPSDKLQTASVAIRVWHSPLWSGYFGGGSWTSGNLAGDPVLLAAEQEHRKMAREIRFVDWYCYSIASGLIGVVVLCLFLIRPADREYLAFATMLLAQAADCFAVIVHEIWSMPAAPVFDMLDGLLNAAIFIANFFFVARVLKVPMRKRSRALVAIAVFSGLCAGSYWTKRVSVPASAALQLICLLPVIVWPIYLLVRKAYKGNRDAQLLLVPVLLASGYYAVDNLIIMLMQAGIINRPAFMEGPLALPLFTVHIQILLDLIFLLGMMVFLIRRFSLSSQREERMAGEFEAARQVQEVLLPEELHCPGFRVESVYRPAEQVGGDFFQQIADREGGLLVVVGDVSGKGLPAAMVVSVLVGAIRAEAGHGTDPATMLQALNARAMGHSHGGFVTCLAARILADGTMTIANAGHLPPYLNETETEIASSLPLGLIEGITYENETVELRPGDVLTFVSDGVVEAQNGAGELLGFERTHRMMGQSAERIAQAAVDFGQVDDITVLTVEYCGRTSEDAAAGTALGDHAASR
jgi:hypothetical protein